MTNANDDRETPTQPLQAARLRASADLPRPPLNAPIKLAYGMGNMVEGVSTTVIGTFLFFYYTAVLGLSGSLVGLAAAVSLVADAIADPLLGSVSDNTRSRWGRRIPFMTFGAPAVALSLGLAFSPPSHASTTLLFIWLTAMSLALRFAVSIFNVPFIALGAELTEDYTERSSVVAYRWMFYIVGLLAATVLGYLVFLAGPHGQLRAAGYPPLAWSTAAIVLIGGVGSVFGVRRFAATLPVSAPDREVLLRRLGGELVEIFRNPSFRIMFFTSVLFWVAQGVAGTLGVHANTFVWRMSPQQIFVTVLAYIIGLVAGVPVAPIMIRRFEKRTVLIAGLAVLALVQGGLSLLRVLGLFTLTGQAVVAPLSVNAIIGGVAVTMTAISVGSMMADAADEHDFLFHRRREGLYFAGLGFAAKGATGLGSLLAGLAIDLIHFPKGIAARGAGVEIAPDIVRSLAFVAGPCVSVVSAIGLAALFFYRIDRRHHAHVLEVLHERRATTA
jgi:GPH family glycoside/pentoside/hexuronide:cation symporter